MAPSKKHLVAAAAASLITATTLAFSSPAYADPAPSDADVASVEGQIAQKQAELSAANEEYLDAKLELEKQNEAKAAADAELATAQADLKAAQAQVAQMGAEAYKSGSLPTSVYLLTGESPAEYIDRANQQQYVDAYYDEQLGQLATAEQGTEEVKAQADQAQAAAAEAEKTIADKKALLEKELPELEEKLASLNEQQQAALAEQSQEATAQQVSDNEASQGQATEAQQPTQAPESGATGSAASVISYAMAQQGKPYVWGGVGPGGFDCSGLTLMAFKQAGISLPHSSGAQAGMGTSVPMSALQPGDLLYGPGHVGLYIGGGQAVHAPTFGQTVTTITASYFSGARRLL